jgi:hypothetical protein
MWGGLLQDTVRPMGDMVHFVVAVVDFFLLLFWFFGVGEGGFTVIIFRISNYH